LLLTIFFKIVYYNQESRKTGLSLHEGYSG
jgi:hypothetical protein